MLTLETVGASEHTINKSRFFAWAARCDSAREVGEFLRKIATEHASASHLAYAYRVKTPDGIVPRFSDAGEPSGTAGKPILQMLDGRNYVNVCIGVIRYYGGIHLGTGGLVRAYSGAAKLALESAQTVEFIEMQTVIFTLAYQQIDAFTRAVTQLKGTMLDKKFDSAAHIAVRIPAHAVSGLQAQFI